MSRPSAVIAFARLTDVPLGDVLALLNEPRHARHMPLARVFTRDEAAAWVRTKDQLWDAHGVGPWAVLIEGAFAGWCGFEPDGDAADFALVLLPEQWGRGAAVAAAALGRGFDELGLDAVTVALPFSRNPTRALARYGFTPDGEVAHGGVTFRRYRLTRADWRAGVLSQTDAVATSGSDRVDRRGTGEGP